ncbi:MAG: hypothetical protein XD60_1722 [Acetothermia bacterium 64_32]|nr:MAG: hypothetical protein XD60_1722 [Acetothermia bacterium 64_32]
MYRAISMAALLLAAGALAPGQSAAELLDQAEGLLATRYLPENLRSAIDLYERALALSPQDTALMTKLAQLWYELGITAEDKASSRRAFQRGADLGFSALGFEGLGEVQKTPAEGFEGRVSQSENVAALYWSAKCWGMLVDTGGLSAQLNAIFTGMPAKVRALYLAAIALDETYFGGGPHEDYGALLVNFTRFHLYGATLEEAKAHFDRAIEIASGAGYLIPFVTYAEQYAVRAGDRALFEDLLRHVLQAPIGDWPFWNRIAKEKAQELLSQADRLFR